MKTFAVSAVRQLPGLAGCALLLLAAPAMARPGGPGWQNTVTYDVPTGQTDLFLHMACPAGYSVTSGGIIPTTPQTIDNGFLLTGDGPRLDETPPAFNEWAWKIEWTAGGAQAGSQLRVDVACKKGAP